MCFTNYSFNGICGDVYDRLYYETHAIKLCFRSIYKHGAITYKNMMIQVICV